MIRRRFGQHQAEEFAQGERVRRSPRDHAFSIQAFEIADQQQPEVASGWQTRTANLRGVESLAQALEVAVEVVLIENLIQSRVEPMRRAPRQILCRHPHRRLLRVPLASAHRHRRQCST